jgi:hypothetical protein
MFLKLKIAIYLSLGPHKNVQAEVQEKPSALRRELPALQNMKFYNFFIFLWVIFALLDPDPADQNQCGSGTLTNIRCCGSGSGSTGSPFLGLPDPDPLVRGMDPDPDPSIIMQIC